MKKKRSMTLMEIMIALFIFSILLTFLFRFFSQVTLVDNKIEKAKKEIFAKHQLYIKLNNLFTQLIPMPYFSSEKEASSFYTKTDKKNNTALFFIFQNGIDPDPKFSGPLHAELVLDKGALTLVFTALDSSKQKRKEILMNNIKSIETQFLYRDDKERTKITWQKNWDKKKKKIPPMIKINLSFLDQKPDIHYVFFLPSCDDTIEYSDNKT